MQLIGNARASVVTMGSNMQKLFQARAWILIERAEDIPGEWVSHCLDFDVVMQGRSIPEALKAVQDAVNVVLIDDLARGADPRARRAPEEHWNHLSQMLDYAVKQPGTAAPPDEAKVSAFAVEMVVSMVKLSVAERAQHRQQAEPLPIVEMAFVQEQRVA
jgi:hypothetical protein